MPWRRNTQNFLNRAMAGKYRIRETRRGWVIEKRGIFFWRRISFASCYWSAVQMLDAIVREIKEDEKCCR